MRVPQRLSQQCGWATVTNGLVLLCFPSLSACGSYFPPSPTSRQATVKELAGKWRYEPLASAGTSVTLKLSSDGTFEQIVKTQQTSHIQSGTWRIDQNEVVFSDILTRFNDWKSSDNSWRIIDRDESPSGFAILGGSTDPDLWVVFDWVGKPKP